MSFRVTSYPKLSPAFILGTFATREAAEAAALACEDNCLLEPAAEPAAEPAPYVILARNGFTFTSEAGNYVIRHHGARVMTDMHKLRVEAAFMRLSR